MRRRHRWRARQYAEERTLTDHRLISGRQVAAGIDTRTREGAATLRERGLDPLLAVVYRGEHGDAASYRKTIAQRAARLGVRVREVPLPGDLDDAGMIDVLGVLNADSAVQGILVQTPLPRLMRAVVGHALAPGKDVEGITPGNLGRLLLGEPEVLPCTAAAIAALIADRVPDLTGKRVVIVNNSATVGRPLVHILAQRRATVTICASATVDLPAETRRAEVLVAAVGRPRFFGPQHVAEGAVVIDVGINECPDGSICGDVDTEAVIDRVAAITPVPGGVGPVTTAMLIANTVELARLQRGRIMVDRN